MVRRLSKNGYGHLHIHAKCTNSAFFSAWTMSGSRFLLLMSCHVLNAVHVGEPTSNVGACASNNFSALALMFGLEKSHGSQISSGTVRSRANPRAMPWLGNSLAKADILGKE